jgi:Co/Zn/Cd efflux system component
MKGGTAEHGRLLLRHILANEDTQKLFCFFLANFLFMLVELSYGMWANSLGLISDAAHMLFDCTALVLGLTASYVARWRPNDVFSYGFARAEVLSGFTNALFLLFIAVYIFIEAVERLLQPPPVEAESLFSVAAIGLLLNLGGLFFFREQHAVACAEPGCSREHGSSSENMRAIFLHILADTLGSVGVIVTSLLISWCAVAAPVSLRQAGPPPSLCEAVSVCVRWVRYGEKALWVDPCCSAIIAVLIGASVVPLLRRSFQLLMNAAPQMRQRSAADWLQAAASLPGVRKIQAFRECCQRARRRVPPPRHSTRPPTVVVTVTVVCFVGGLLVRVCVFIWSWSDCWALAPGQPVVTLHVEVEEGAGLGQVRRQLGALFHAAGVSREGGHLAVELRRPAGTDELC